MVPTPFALSLATPVRRVLAGCPVHPGQAVGRSTRRRTERAFSVIASDYTMVTFLTPLLARLEEEAPGVACGCRRPATTTWSGWGGGQVDLVVMPRGSSGRSGSSPSPAVRGPVRLRRRRRTTDVVGTRSRSRSSARSRTWRPPAGTRCPPRRPLPTGWASAAHRDHHRVRPGPAAARGTRRIALVPRTAGVDTGRPGRHSGSSSHPCRRADPSAAAVAKPLRARPGHQWLRQRIVTLPRSATRPVRPSGPWRRGQPDPQARGRTKPSRGSASAETTRPSTWPRPRSGVGRPEADRQRQLLEERVATNITTAMGTPTRNTVWSDRTNESRIPVLHVVAETRGASAGLIEKLPFTWMSRLRPPGTRRGIQWVSPAMNTGAEERGAEGAAPGDRRRSRPRCRSDEKSVGTAFWVARDHDLHVMPCRREHDHVEAHGQVGRVQPGGRADHAMITMIEPMTGIRLVLAGAGPRSGPRRWRRPAGRA